MGETKRYPSQQQDRFIVRLPDGMRRQIAEAASKNGRSMNTEIVMRLEASFEAEEPAPVTTQFLDRESRDDALVMRIRELTDAAMLKAFKEFGIVHTDLVKIAREREGGNE